METYFFLLCNMSLVKGCLAEIGVDADRNCVLCIVQCLAHFYYSLEDDDVWKNMFSKLSKLFPAMLPD